MEYAAMLGSPDLVLGLRDLLTDSDVAVVKRTIRVFANVYRHALQLLAAGNLEEATFKAAWPAVRSVATQVVELLTSCENEGVIVHVVRFLEAALVAHLLCDVSRFPDVAAHTPIIILKGVKALTDLISTPYVGGSAFLVAVRSLITVACYKQDLWPSVTSLIERQIASPPPTLFDHNVRSLHKILQRNLFRLLRRADTSALRSQLIEMMVTVGVPRRMLAQWAPPQEAKKRPTQAQSEDAITGRISPPNKRPRTQAEDEPSIPRDPREGAPLRDPRINGSVPRDPRTAPRSDPRLGPPKDPRVAAPVHDSTSAPSKRSTRPISPPTSDSTSPPDEPPSAPAPPSLPDTPLPVQKKETVSSFEFLRGLLARKKQASAVFLEQCSKKERALYERLDHPSVVRLVLSCLDTVSDTSPEELLKKLGRASGDVTGIREQLTSLLAPHIHSDFISGLAEDESISAPPSRPSSTSSSLVRASPPQSENSAPSPPSSARSTPSDPAQMCQSDVDLRQLLNRNFRPTGDVDMRDTADVDMRDTRNLVPRDTRPSPAHTHASAPAHTPASAPASVSSLDTREAPRHTDTQLSFPTSTILDPRITSMPDPVLIKPEPDPLASTDRGLNPCITQAFTDSQHAMLLRQGVSPFQDGARLPFMGPPTLQPPPGYMSCGPPGFMEALQPPFMNGPGSMMGMRHGFDIPPFDRHYSGPQMGGPPPGMMGEGARGIGGPWQGTSVSQPGRMGMMMNGPGIFTPPMHL